MCLAHLGHLGGLFPGVSVHRDYVVSGSSMFIKFVFIGVTRYKRPEVQKKYERPMSLTLYIVG